MSSHRSTLDGPLHKQGAPIRKAARLLAQDRIMLEPDSRVYAVLGDSDVTYRVIASPLGISCPCPARTGLCSHAIAVAHLWTRDRVTGVIS